MRHRTNVMRAAFASGCVFALASIVTGQECENPTTVLDGENAIDMSSAVPGSSDCMSGAVAYFNYSATDTGEVEMIYCADGDGGAYALEVSAGCACPNELNTMLECTAVDAPDPKCGTAAKVTFSAKAGECYTVVIVHEASAGSGTLSARPLITGACCIDGSCSVTEMVLCGLLGGEFQGAFVPCSDVECPQPPCPGDLDGDGVIDTTDLLIFLGSWGACTAPLNSENAGADDCPADLDFDNTVGTSDLLLLLSFWGPC